MSDEFKRDLEPSETLVMKQTPDGHVHTMPMSGPTHVESADCWCKPELIFSGDEGQGQKNAYLHREIQ